MTKSRIVAPENCPVCGAGVPVGALACPNCGADERSGWNENEARYDGLDLPDRAFEDSAGPTPRSRAKTRVNGIPVFWWWVGLALAAVLTLLALGLI